MAEQPLLPGLAPTGNPFSILPSSQLSAIFQTLLKSLKPEEEPTPKQENLPVDENFLLMIESLTPRTSVQKPAKLRTDADYKQWNAQRQRQNRRKLNEMLDNSSALQHRLKTELAENAVRLKRMLFHDNVKVAAKLKVASFLGTTPEVVEQIPQIHRFFQKYTEQRIAIAEVDVEPKSSIFREKASKLEKKYLDYKTNRVEARVPSDLRKKMTDAMTRAKCYDLFMDGKRVKKVISELQINEEELQQNVEIWMQSVSLQMKNE